MIRFAIGSVSLLLSSCVLAQVPPAASQFVAIRQPEVEGMAEMFYNTHLDRGEWNRHNLTECATLAHHAFIRFDGASVNGAPTSFLAIYDLDHPAARSLNRPWQGGITFVRVPPHQDNPQDSGPSPDFLIVAFNRALKQEHVASPLGQPQTLASVQATAGCFIDITDNVPKKEDPNQNTAPSASPLTATVSGIIIPLTGGSNFSRSQYINLDKDGLILDAGISTTPK